MKSLNSFGRSPVFPERWLWMGRLWHLMRRLWRWGRVQHPITALLGPQYRRSRNLLEIDITYACNLHCLNCNRSVRQAPETLHLGLERVRELVDTCIARGKRWRRIRILGGEPTLHPQFMEIIRELLRYRLWWPETVIEVVTNGHGTEVANQLQRLPAEVHVENSSKQGAVQPAFAPFNLAPVDDPAYARADFSNGCAIMQDCGMGLTPLGFYPCAVAGGIDRISGDQLGRNAMPDDSDDMGATLARLCRLCGRFHDGHYIPKNMRPPLLEEKMTSTWRELYDRWRQKQEAISKGRSVK